ncbi:hypothetical protein SRHO_G00052120 [Serrasalmus rhombeus]
MKRAAWPILMRSPSGLLSEDGDEVAAPRFCLIMQSFARQNQIIPSKRIIGRSTISEVINCWELWADCLVSTSFSKAKGSVTSCQDERAVEWEEKGGRIEQSTESAPRLSAHPIAPPKVLNIIILFWFWD